MEVLIGLDNLDDLKSVEKRNISNVVIHELFTSTAVRDENDIAIATLNLPVVFNDNIVPICLPKPGLTKIFFVLLSFSFLNNKVSLEPFTFFVLKTLSIYS